MSAPDRFSAAWLSGKNFDLTSEHGEGTSTKRGGYERDTTRDIPETRSSRLHWVQRHPKKRNFWRAGLLLISLTVLRYVYLGAFLHRQIKSLNSEDQAPVLHFSTAKGTRSPPLGLFIDDNKIWHMYFESFPDPNRTSHGVSWGHVTSSDLYTWSMQPIALQSDTYDIGSGSIVLDKNNTSGLFPNQTDGVIAILTKQHRGTGGQVQAIMSSNDGGYTFIENPKAPRIPGSEGSENFRDPKVIWHEPNQRWVMTASKAASTAVGIYTSPNLIDWVLASEFNNKHLLDAGYEVEHPNLVPIPRLNSTGARNKNHPTVPGGTVKDFGDYVLVGSSREGSPLNGGSVTRYFPGKFNGTHFEPTNNRTDQFIDFGPDNYATQFFFGLPHGAPVVGLGLASNLHYTKSPTSHGISRTTTFTGPREGYLIHDPGEGELSFFTRPFNLDAFREEILANYSAQHLLEHNVVFNGSDAVLVETRFEMLPPDDEMVELNVDFIFRSLISAEQIFCTIVFNTWAADFGCDRSEAFSKWLVGSSRLNQMSARQVRPLLPFHNPAVRRWEVQAFMDRSILEVFLNDGVKAGTTTIFSESPIDSIRFQSSKIPTWATLGVTVQRLRSKEVHYGIAHDSLSSPIDALQEKKDLEHIKVYQYVVAASLFARESICGAISDVLQMLASGSVPTKTRGCPLTYE